MEVRFFLTGQDRWNMIKYDSTRTRKLISTGISLSIISVLIVVYALISPPSEVLTNLLSILLFFLGLFLLVVFLRWRIRHRAIHNLTLQGEHIITITPQGLQHRTNLTDSLISWQAIKTITADKYDLYFVRESNRLVAHVIPRRAFGTPQEAEAFLALAQSYWKNG